MVENKTIGMMTLVALLLAGFALVGNEDLEPTHFCEDKELIAHCFQLSSTSKTCYTEPARTGGKRCGVPWQQIDKEVVDPVVDEPVDDVVDDIVDQSVEGSVSYENAYCKSPGGNVLVRCESLA